MIDLFAVVSTGGVVHWTFTSHSFDHRALLNTILLQQGGSHGQPLLAQTATVDNFQVEWLENRTLNLIYIVACPRMFSVAWAGSLLRRIDRIVEDRCRETLIADPFSALLASSLDDAFPDALRREETKSRSLTGGEKRGDKPTQSSKPTTQKPQRTWGDRANRAELAALDYSSSARGDNQPQTGSHSPSMPTGKDRRMDLSEDSDSEDERKEVHGGWWETLQSLTGTRAMTETDLEPALLAMKTHLVGKNVAHGSAQTVCAAVGQRLVGVVPGTFSSVARLVRRATREVLQSVLATERPADLLASIKRVRVGASPRPFVIAFVGVNGVGKSTSLAKVACWLLQHQLRVLIVAGDTFRSGAVEQLRVHVNNLRGIVSSSGPGQVELFERGYGRDAAEIAREAIASATARNFDVVLVDTAGRMQDNGPLMRALAKLISINAPDRILFVGEALVGHDALDQLSKFNAALLDHHARPIDGLLLTKVDTIDDKIGAALSMTLAARAPILFVGVGQTYRDLRRLHVGQVVDALLK